MLQYDKGAFNNYVDKMRWVGAPNTPIFVQVQSIECPHRGRSVIKKGQHDVHVVIE